jgi:hypothetical protein
MWFDPMAARMDFCAMWLTSLVAFEQLKQPMAC